MKLEVYSSKDKLIKTYNIIRMSHWHAVRDWNLETDKGLNIEVSADIIKVIVKHENKESGS